jgi:hypothetical protein
MLHKITAAIGGGVSVATSLEGYSWAMNVSIHQSSYPSPLTERLGTNPTGFTSVGNQSKIVRCGTSSPLLFFLIFYSPSKANKNI